MIYPAHPFQVSQKNMQIKRLKVDINTTIKLAEDANRRVRADASKQQSVDEKGHEERKVKLQEDIATHKKKLQEEIVAHREKEQELRKVRKPSHWLRLHCLS